MAIYICKQCQREFRRSGRRMPIFCSVDCKARWQQDSKCVSRDWLYQKYVTERLGTYQIAKLVGRNPKRVFEWLKGYGIPTRKREWGTVAGLLPYHNANWLLREYVVNNRSATSIAEQFGVEAANIYHFLRQFGIKRRNISQARSVKHWGQHGQANPMFGKRGEQTPNWKGGVTPERQSLYLSQEWKQAVSIVWKRDNATCQRCGTTKQYSVTFHVHHIVSFAMKELRTDPNNLILLCDKCHRWVHSKKNVNGEFLKDLHDD